MNPFKAWHLPPPLSVDAMEVRQLDEGAPPSEPASVLFPALTDHRFRQITSSLRRAAGEVLLQRPVNSIVESVGLVAHRFLDPGDELRSEAVAQVAFHAGYSGAMASEVVTGMARGWTGDSLRGLLAREFPDPLVLDGFRPDLEGGSLRAAGYPLSMHVGAGTVPGVSVTSLIRSLLVKSAILLKPGRADVAFPVVFARGLEEVDPELGRCVAVLYWPGSASALTERALGEADLVVGYGSDETLREIRDKVPLAVPFIGYRHRLGVALVGRRQSETYDTRTADDAAEAVAFFDQKGCVSPHLIFVESDTDAGAEKWSAHLAQALTRLEERLPSGSLSPEEGSALQQLRGMLELKEVAGEGRVFHGGGGAPWTVAFNPGGPLEPSCLNRTVRVMPLRRLMDSLPLLMAWEGYLQTVGVANIGEEEKDLLYEGLARLGVSRIVPLRDVPWPDPWWHHDGSGPLRVLVRWADAKV